ncbi:MAG: CRTAC1 family protein, partial [Planctomycetota bacterium]
MNLLVAAIVAVAFPTSGQRFADVTDAVGLGPEVVGTGISRCCFADLNGDGRADAVVDRHRVFLNVADESGASPIGRRFVEIADCGLPAPQRGDIAVFADIDNDGGLDAVIARYVDLHNESWTDDGVRTRWLPGRGDGTFGAARPITLAQPATTSAVAVGDVNHDGRLDLWLGNWYVHYGESLAGYPNDLLFQEPPGWQALRLPDGVAADVAVDEETDLAGRPTYGAMIADLDGLGRPELLELNYGRRWSRCHLWLTSPDGDPPARWTDIAPRAGLDGDDVRHGRYPEWLKERAKEDPRFDRDDEKPFRANGNTFDCAVGDIDSDGDFDLFLSEITHAWAGDSSDPSRFLVSRLAETGRLEFEYDPRLSVDRVPAEGNRWNQGDLFCALADMDNDGRLDLLLSSGDYPDDQRLRLYRQQADGTFANVTADVGLDHDGSQMISLADVEGDGDLDILVGQTFFRYTPEMKEGRQPRLRLFVNETNGGGRGLVLRLEGDPDLGANRNGLGAIVKVTVGDVTMQRQLIGVGGHSGKQQDFAVHFGLGSAERADRLVVVWPDAARTTQVFADVAAGEYTLRQAEALKAPGGDEGYAGLKLRDIPGGHTIVSWILPGPLQGEGLTAPAFDLGRPDLVVAVNGRPMNAEQFKDLVRSAAPGVPVTLEYRRSRNRGGGIPDDLDHEDEVRTVEIVIASRDEWIGTIGRRRGHDVEATIDKPYLLDPFAVDNILGAAVAEHELAEPIENLVGAFEEWLEKGEDYHLLSRFRLAFENPLQLPEVERLVVGSVDGLPRYGPSFMLNAAARNLDVPSGWGDSARDAPHRLIRSVGPERTIASRVARV